MFHHFLQHVFFIIICTSSATFVEASTINKSNADTQKNASNTTNVFAKGLRGFWVARITQDNDPKQSQILNISSLKIPHTPNTPPYKTQSKFGSASIITKGKTCTFEVVTSTIDPTKTMMSVQLSPFYRVNKKGKIRGGEKRLERCRSLGVVAYDLYAIKKKLLGAEIKFENGETVKTLFKPQGGANLNLGSVKIIKNNAELFDVLLSNEIPAQKNIKPKSSINEKAPIKPIKTNNKPSVKTKTPPQKEEISKPVKFDTEFTAQHPNFDTFQLPLYKGIPALVASGLLANGLKVKPTYQSDFIPARQLDWYLQFRALRDFLDIAPIIDNKELVKWYQTHPKGEDGGAPSLKVALDKRRADWMLEIIKKAFLGSAKIETIHKYFCPRIDMKSLDFNKHRCSRFNGSPFEKRRLLATFIKQAIPELITFAKPLENVHTVVVLHRPLVSKYDFDQKGFLVQLFNDYTFTPFGQISTMSSSDYAREFKARHPVFETMYIGPSSHLSGRGASGAFLPMDEVAAEALMNKAKANGNRYATSIKIELIPEDLDVYRQRIMNDRKLTQREYRYKLLSKKVDLYLATSAGLELIHRYPVNVKPIK